MLGTAILEFQLKMIPFVIQLPLCLGDGFSNPASANQSFVKMIPAAQGFIVHFHQISRNCRDWSMLVSKSNELRVMKITFRLSKKHGLCKKALSPERQ